MSTKLRVNVNGRSVISLIELVSNSVLLGTNVYVIGTSINNAVRLKKEERIRTNLELSGEAASALASLTKVVVEGINNGKNNKDL